MEELPFMFIGSKNNDPTIDEPPLYPIASLNLAHYRNSADYEEACFITGQPTPVAIGLTESWLDTIMKGVFKLGSRAFVPLPAEADAKLLQAEPNIMPIEAMKHKEDQMMAIGAKLVETEITSAERTATEVTVENASETSILESTAVNVSRALEWALTKCVLLLGESVEENSETEEGNVTYELLSLIHI